MSQPKSVISKSAFLCGAQCPKLLWHAVNTRDLLPEPDPAQQAIVDQGSEVGLLARQLFPTGMEVGDDNVNQAAEATSEALRLLKPLFEAAFQTSSGYCRVDVLAPAEGDGWNLDEVKSTASVKSVHLHDVAFQAWVLANAGVPVNQINLIHVDPDYVRSGPVEPQRLFATVDITADASALVRTVESKVSKMLSIIRLPSPPEVSIGPHCDDPYTCPLHDHCWGYLPKQNVLTLYHNRKKGFQLLARGIVHLREIPGDVALTAKQTIQKCCAETGRPQVDEKAIAAFLKRLRYPLHFLDFETFNTAVPLFDGVRPYQQVPFQFSLHLVRTAGEEPEHKMFLADGRGDPRPEFMKRFRD